MQETIVKQNPYVVGINSAISSTIDYKNIYIELLNFLNIKNISYAFTASTLESILDSSEVNIFVSTSDFSILKEHISGFCYSRDLLLIQKIKRNNDSVTYVIAHVDQHSSKVKLIRINFYSSLTISGHKHLTADQVLKHRQFISNLNAWVLGYTHLFLFILLRSDIKNKFSIEEFQLLKNCWDNETLNITSVLQLKYKVSANIISDCLHNGNYEDLIRWISLMKSDSDRVLSPFFGKGKHMLGLLKSIFKPNGLVVGVLGRDGSGKSTFINALSQELENGFCGTAYFKRHPKVLYKNHVFKKGADYHFTKPHLYKERGYIASFIKLTLLLVEFTVGYWLKVFPIKRSCYLVLYDRYFIDVLTDPLRYRIKGNRTYIKAIHYFLPKPDLWIILDMSSEVLLSRKQELTHEMSEKLRAEYLKVQPLLTNCVVIDNGEELFKTINKAASFIVNFMHREYLKLYN